MKTRIKEILEKTYQGKVTGYKVTLENGEEGYLDDKNSDEGLKVGEVVDYSLIVKQNKTTKKDYNLFTIKRSVSEMPQKELKTETKPPKIAFPLSESEIVNYKINGIFTSIKEAMKAWIANTITWDKLPEIAKSVRDYIWEGIDEIKNKE
jgi:hypothetical protein